jgi:hypothetical protein
MTHPIDVASIDREQFAVVEDPHGNDEVLIVARRGKYSYHAHERLLRALLVTRSGEVLSTGYPKFDNYGESPEIDAAFDRAFALGGVTFREKIDGTLIIADVIRGEVRLRTRGRPGVEWERDAFESLLAREYPDLRARLAREPAIRAHSILIECTLVERPLVLRYDRSKLTFVGLVHKQRIEPVIDVAVEEAVAARLGLDIAPLVTVGSPEELQDVQRAKGREGLVARFRDGDGPDARTLMLKLKSSDFFRLHGLRARLNESRVRQIAIILDLREEDDFLRMTAKYGLDWEAAQMALPFVAPLVAKKREALALFDALKALVEPALGDRDESAKPAYVRRLREVMASDPRFAHKMWFYAGIEWFVRPARARMVLDSNLFDETLVRVQEWSTDPDRYVRALIEAPSERGADEA